MTTNQQFAKVGDETVSTYAIGEANQGAANYGIDFLAPNAVVAEVRKFLQEQRNRR